MAGVKGRSGGARRAGTAFQLGISPRAVFKRDGWICQICGRSTLREKQPRSGPRSLLTSELDHIVPIGKGGSHTWDNVQCLCRRCNHEKADRVEDRTETLHRVMDAERQRKVAA